MTNYSWNATGSNACYTGHYPRSNSPSGCCKTPNQALQCCENPQSLQNRCTKFQGQGCRSPRNALYYYVSPTFYQNGNKENHCCEKNTKLESEPKPKKKICNIMHEYATVRHPKLTTCLQKCETYLANCDRSVSNKNINSVNKDGKSRENTRKLASCPPENCETSCEKAISSKCCKKKLDKTKDKSTTADNCNFLTCDKHESKAKTSHPKDLTDTIQYTDSLPDCCKDSTTSTGKSEAEKNKNTIIVSANNDKKELLPNYFQNDNKIKLMVSQLENMENYSVRKYITTSEKIVGKIQDKNCSTDGISGKKTKLTCEKEACPKLRKCKRNATQTSTEVVLDNTEYNDNFSDCCNDSTTDIALECSKKGNSSLNYPNKATDNRYYVSSYKQTLIIDPNKKSGSSHSRNERDSPDCCKNDILNSSAFKKDVTDITIIKSKALSTSNIGGTYKPGWTTLGNNKISQFAYSKERILLELTKKQSQEKAINILAFPASYTEAENQVDVVTDNNSSDRNSEVRLEFTSQEHKEYLNSNDEVETVELKIESIFIKTKDETIEPTTTENGNGHEAKEDLYYQSLLSDSGTDPPSSHRKIESIGTGSSRHENKNEVAKENISNKNCLVPDCCTDTHLLSKKRVSIGSTTSRDENKDEPDKKPLVSHSSDKKKGNRSSTDANKLLVPSSHKKEELISQNSFRDQDISKHGAIGSPPYDEKRLSITIEVSDITNKNDPAVKKCPENKPLDCCMDKKGGTIGTSSSRKNNSFHKENENRSSTEANKHSTPHSHPLHKKQDCICISKNKEKHDALFDGKSSKSSTLPEHEHKVKPECCNKKPRIDNSQANTKCSKNGSEQRKSMSDYNDCCKGKMRSSKETRSLEMPLPEGLPKWLSCCKSTKCPVNDATASTYAFLLKTRLCCNHKDCKLAAQICDLYEPQNIKIHISKADNFGNLDYHYLATDAETAYEPIPTEPVKYRSDTQKIVNESTIQYNTAYYTVGYVPNIEYGAKKQSGSKPERERKNESSTVEMFNSGDDDAMYRESVYISPEANKTTREVSRESKDKGDKNPVIILPEVSQERRVSTVSWNIPSILPTRTASISRLEIDISVSTAEIITQATAEADKFRQPPQPILPPAALVDIHRTEEPIIQRQSSANISDDVIIKSELNSLKTRESRHHSTCWNFIKHKIRKRRESQGSDGSSSAWSSGAGSQESEERKRPSIAPVEEKQLQINNMLNNL